MKNKLLPILSLFFFTTFSIPVQAFEYDDLIPMFEKDANRANPVDMLERFKAIINEVTGMEIKNEITIRLESIGILRQKKFEKNLNLLYQNVEEGIMGEEFLLKSLRIIKKDEKLLEILRDNMYGNASGMYSAEDKELLLMKGISKFEMQNVLLHELIHAAQDSYIDLNLFYESIPITRDAYLAAASLVEGQDSVIEFLINLENNIGTNEPIEETLKKTIASMEMGLAEMQYDNVIYLWEVFPYSYGLNFALKLYTKRKEKDFIKMFDKIPSSSEQILHFDKFEKNEKPKPTPLEIRKNLFKDGTKEIYSDTMGEFFIKVLFNKGLEKEKKANQKASEGWGGDCVKVFKSKGKLFYLWDTLWDTRKDAKEFFTRYQTFAKKSFSAKKLFPAQSFSAAYPEKNPYFFIKMKGKRVFIMEGKVEKKMIKEIVRKLNI